MEDAEAKTFLEKHPEFDDRFLEQSEINNPGFNTAEGRYTLNEVPHDHTAHADTMQEAVRLMSPGPAQELLKKYYAGLSIVELMAHFKIPRREILDNRITRAKKRALRQLKKHPPARLFDQTPHATKVFSKGPVIKFIYLVWDETIKEHIWVNDEGEPFPANVQELLDTSEEFREWDTIWLD